MTNKEAIKMQEAIKAGLKETGKDHPYRDALIPLMKESCDMAIEALNSSEIPNGSDTISRQAAIDALRMDTSIIPFARAREYVREAIDTIYNRLEELPSAQPKTFRVIDNRTGQEADPYEIALHEEWAKGLVYCDMEGFAIEEDGTLILVDECGRYEYCPEGRFEVAWDE